jgi:hypothetical protein
VVGEDLTNVVFVPTIVHLEIDPELRGAGLRGIALASQRAGYDAIGHDVAAPKARDQGSDLFDAALGQDVIVQCTERRLSVADQPDAWDPRPPRRDGWHRAPWTLTARDSCE